MVLRHWLGGLLSRAPSSRNVFDRRAVRRRGFRAGLVLEALEDRTLLSALQVGIMGDSLSDEYFEESYDYAQNWVEQLVALDRLDAGPRPPEGENWGDVRRTGFEFNWARAGASSDELISGGQHTGLASQIEFEGIGNAVLAIGGNDFFPADEAYWGNYFELWDDAEVDAYVASRVDNLITILDVVQLTGVNLLVANFPDYGLAPATVDEFPDPQGRDRVTAVIGRVNAELAELARERQLPLVDLFGFTRAVFGPNTDLRESISMGGVEIQLRERNLPPTDPEFAVDNTLGFVHDGAHPHDLVQGGLAALFVHGLNVGYDAGLEELTEREIVELAGLTYVEDTFFGSAAIGSLSDYILLPGDPEDPEEPEDPGDPVILQVTTFADVVDPDDGLLSLREAILQANQSEDPFIIQLEAGTYTLTRSGAFENFGARGDLDIRSGGSVRIVGLGADQTVIDAGNLGDRIFDVHSGASLEVQGVTLTGGFAPRIAGTIDRSGGAIRNLGGTITVADSTISDSSAEVHGGGIFNFGSLTITNSAISGNTVSGAAFETSGGGIHNWFDSTVTVTGSTLSGNVADLGGAIFSNGTLSITGSTLSGNSAVMENGGGIYSAFGVLTLSESTLSGNSAAAGGGGIFATEGTELVTGSTISGNSATRGGGIDANGTMTVTGSTISGNASSQNTGGGIRASGTTTITDSTVSDNSGGGIFNVGTTHLFGSTVSGNSSNTHGGGIWNSEAGTLTLTNSTLSGNSAMVSGGGVYNVPTGESPTGSVTLTNSTLTGNLANSNNAFGAAVGTGGGIWTRDDEGVITRLNNTIVAGNETRLPLFGPTVANEFAGGRVDPDSAHNLVGDADSAGGLVHGQNGNVVGNEGTGVIDIDTVLNTTLANNGGPTLTHALVSGSPALDSGDNSLAIGPDDEPLVWDQRGEPFERVFDGTVDIGAVELSDILPPPGGEGILLFDDETGLWHHGRNFNGRLEQESGPAWSAETEWEFHQGDFTGNGRTDVAARQTGTGQWWLLESTGNGLATTFWGRWASDEQAEWSDVRVGDFNGDGRDDVVGRTGTGQVWVAESTGGSFVNRFYANWSATGWTSSAWTHVVVGDFNGDGRDGLAGMRDSGHWYFAQTNDAGRFTTTQVGRWSGTAEWRHVMAADFTGDGRSDLIGQTATGQWWVGASQTTSLTNYFAGAWSPAAGFEEVFTGDFDLDGRADIASRTSDGEWFVLRSNGFGARMTNEYWGRWSPTADWTTIVADVDGDGRTDIAGYEANSGQVWVAVSNGNRFVNTFFGQWEPLESVGFAAAGIFG